MSPRSRTASFGVTMRSFSREARGQMLDNVVEVLRGIASAYGVTVDIEYREQYPPTINHDAEVDFLESTVREIHGEHRWARMPNPVAGAEDFSRVLEQVPGTYAFLGATTGPDPLTAPSNHSPLADFDDAVLGDGAALLAELATRRLARTAS
jgi:hippurate hydrolase